MKNSKIKEFDSLVGKQYLPPNDEYDYLFELQHRAARNTFSKGGCIVELLSAFNLGRICGIRQERERRKERSRKKDTESPST